MKSVKREQVYDLEEEEGLLVKTTMKQLNVIICYGNVSVNANVKATSRVLLLAIRSIKKLVISLSSSINLIGNYY